MGKKILTKINHILGSFSYIVLKLNELVTTITVQQNVQTTAQIAKICHQPTIQITVKAFRLIPAEIQTKITETNMKKESCVQSLCLIA